MYSTELQCTFGEEIAQFEWNLTRDRDLLESRVRVTCETREVQIGYCFQLTWAELRAFTEELSEVHAALLGYVALRPYHQCAELQFSMADRKHGLFVISGWFKSPLQFEDTRSPYQGYNIDFGGLLIDQSYIGIELRKLKRLFGEYQIK